MISKKEFVFNFVIASSGGSYNRLYAFSQWFNEHGGATFIINSRCSNLLDVFINNHYIVLDKAVSQPRSLFHNTPLVYYSYGLPIQQQIGQINWFHLNNILPFCLDEISIPIAQYLKLSFQRYKIQHYNKKANILSAESNFSLKLMDCGINQQRILSVNGCDQEMNLLASPEKEKKNQAIIIGTAAYKCLNDSFDVFQFIQKQNKEELKCVIIGDEKLIPKSISQSPNVVMMGCLPHQAVLQQLCQSKYYIATNRFDNSYTAAIEGATTTSAAFIADIEPFQEGLRGCQFNKVFIPQCQRTMLYVERKNMSLHHLKRWSDVVEDMIHIVNGTFNATALPNSTIQV